MSRAWKSNNHDLTTPGKSPMTNQVIDVEENDESPESIRLRNEQVVAPKSDPDELPDTALAQRLPFMKWLGWLAVVATAFAAGRFFSGGSSHQAKVGLGDIHSGVTDRGSSIVVTAEPVQVRPIQRTVDAVGTLYGFEELTISSKLEGRVAKIHHDLSSVVAPDELLLELDETDARLAVEQAERSLQAELSKWGFSTVPTEGDDLGALPTVVSAKQKYDLAKSRLDRMLPLESTNSISIDDLEQAKSDARVQEFDWRNQLLMAQAAAATARLRSADLAIAKQRLIDCQIRVPVPTLSDREQNHLYTVSERMVSEGTLLRPGTEVFRLVLGNTLKLRLSVPESQSSKVEVGQTVSISTTSLNEPRSGRVSKISPSIDRSTRTFIVEVTVPNEDRRCKPGSFAKAKILVGEAEPTMTIPMSGLYSLAGVNKIFLIEEGKAKEYQVTLGAQSKDWVEIATPLISQQAKVVTSGQRMLSDGVEVVERAVSSSTSAEFADQTKAAGARASEANSKESKR
jgi:RND family efflux transporter MFP subunit